MNIRPIAAHELPELLRLYQQLHASVIENVVTHSAHRSRGHGQALLRHALSFAWSQGCYKVMLMTGRKDEAIFRFYESAGFDRHDKQAFIARPEA